MEIKQYVSLVTDIPNDGHSEKESWSDATAHMTSPSCMNNHRGIITLWEFTATRLATSVTSEQVSGPLKAI
jgi:hypothetical protein